VNGRLWFRPHWPGLKRPSWVATVACYALLAGSGDEAGMVAR
jgi:hypothetical protein